LPSNPAAKPAGFFIFTSGASRFDPHGLFINQVCCQGRLSRVGALGDVFDGLFNVLKYSRRGVSKSEIARHCPS
jgi:hypothetical protein